jgi:hypothetical protein
MAPETEEQKPERSWLYAERRAHDGGGIDDWLPFLAVALPLAVADVAIYLWVSQVVALVLLALLIAGGLAKAALDLA